MKKKYFFKFFIGISFLAVQMMFGQTTTWTGSAWDNGDPSITTDAIVLSGTCNVTSNTSFKTITVQADAILNVDNAATITVQDNIQVLGTGQLILNNNTSLLQNNSSATNTGNIKYRRNATPMRQYEFTYWGAPVVGQVLNVFSPLTLADKFYSYNANIGVNNWVIENQNNVMMPAKGYAIRAPQVYTTTPQVFSGEFIGVPNNGNISANVAGFNPALLNYLIVRNH